MLKPHPLAEIFPPMSDEAFQALVADIRESGLREPIILHEGMILDGRNRYRACSEVGIEPITRPWDQRGTALAFVISKNLHRRHLNESQRAMVAERIATLKNGGDRRTESFSASIEALKSQPNAAALMNVSRASVQRARVIRDHGAPELQSAVEAGKVSVYAAEMIALEPQEEQRVIVARGEKAVKKVGTELRAQRNSKKDASRVQARIQQQRVKADIWIALRDALNSLTSLPLPSEVALIARGHDRTNLVNARLPQSMQWLEEFASAWRSATSERSSASTQNKTDAA